jgi:hypothetical protein
MNLVRASAIDIIHRSSSWECRREKAGEWNSLDMTITNAERMTAQRNSKATNMKKELPSSRFHARIWLLSINLWVCFPLFSAGYSFLKEDAD